MAKENQMQMQDIEILVEQYHKALPNDLRQWLNQRCISDQTINTYALGFDGNRITIPISEETGAYQFFKRRKDPRKDGSGEKYLFDKGSTAQLYGIENLLNRKDFVVLCEGELDRLVLEDRGIPAVTSTAGAGTFKDEWVKHFTNAHVVYIVYDNDEPGQINAEKLLKKIPGSRMVTLPHMGDRKKDITDYFMLGKTKEDFMKLLHESKSTDEIRGLSMLQSLTMQGDPIDFNPSQQVIENRLYFTIPAYRKNTDEKSKTVFNKSFLVINNDREILVLESERDFYEKYGFHVRQLPKVKNQKSRWSPDDISTFIKQGFTPNPYEVFKTIREVIKKYSELKCDEYYDTIAMWIMGTYSYQGFEAYPYLGFTGMQGSGKSKILRILDFLCFNGQQVVNVSEASLFRDIESLRPTVIIDEGEFLNDKKNKEAMFALLNSGYSRGPGVPRQVKDASGDMSTQYFQIYSPKAIANIAGFETVLSSRMIGITMIRASGDRGWTNPSENSEDWTYLRHELYSNALCEFRNIQKSYHQDTTTRINNNRSNDLWSPLLSIAKSVFRDHPDEFNRFKEFARKEISRTARNSLDEPTKALLEVLSTMILKDDWYGLEDIRAKVALYFKMPLSDQIDGQWVGYRLKGFGFERKQRSARGMNYYFTENDVKDLLNRYRNEMSEETEYEYMDSHKGNSQKMSGVSGQQVFVDQKV
jgi:5S rRNA maturation endonuclease (ribonuclease M5)